MRFFRRERIDIVHSFFFDSAVLGTMSGRLARTPVKILSRRDMGFWETPAKRRVMKLVSRMSDRLLVNSESVRRRIVEDEGVPAEKIDVIYNGIDTKPFDKGAPRAQSRAKFNIADNSPVVGIVANLNREVKRVDLFIEAADIVMRKFPTAKFLVAGEGRLRSTLEEKSRSASLNGAVQFLGPEKDIPSLLSALDVAVNCSDSEGLSNAVIEYMAAGLPAVVSNVPGNCELVTDGIEGLHFSAGDAPALADRIKFLLSNSQEAAQMGQRGREKVGRRLSSEVMIQQHMDYYSRLLQDKG
jgi:glycosyltransferase involved in cell wall biosynthesis